MKQNIRFQGPYKNTTRIKRKKREREREGNGERGREMERERMKELGGVDGRDEIKGKEILEQ